MRRPVRDGALVIAVRCPAARGRRSGSGEGICMSEVTGRRSRNGRFLSASRKYAMSWGGGGGGCKLVFVCSACFFLCQMFLGGVFFFILLAGDEIDRFCFTKMAYRSDGLFSLIIIYVFS